ncbi:MAG: FMN-binding negative transcriptional regulator [Verrucomicrobiota bacterium]
MYSPAHFRIDDRNAQIAFMKEHSFASLVTVDGGSPFASHVPVLVQENRGPCGTLVTHLARPNPQWRHFENGADVLVMFSGPHADVSPAWYVTTPAVPTWNYTAVHVYGKARIVGDHAQVVSMLHELVEANEANREERWSGEMPDDFRDNLIRGIVGVEIEITRIEAKFKLSQNRPADVSGVVAALATSPNQTDRQLAEMMSRQVR